MKDRKSNSKSERKSPEAATESQPESKPQGGAAEATIADVVDLSDVSSGAGRPAAGSSDGASEQDGAPGQPASQRVRQPGGEPPESSEQAEDLPPLDELDVVRAERDALQDKLLRLAAEYDNFRKRNAREWQDHRKRAATEVMREMLEICDNIERALDTASEDAGGLRKGVEMIHQQFHAMFKRFGIEAFEAEGQPFDPHKHEAVQMIESDEFESQHIVNVVQRGYLLHGEVLRPARVVVSK